VNKAVTLVNTADRDALHAPALPAGDTGSRCRSCDAGREQLIRRLADSGDPDDAHDRRLDPYGLLRVRRGQRPGTRDRGRHQRSRSLGGARAVARQGSVPKSLKEAATGENIANKSISIGAKKVKPKSLQIFSRQFATMIEAGLNVVGALVILEEQTDDEALAAIVYELRQDVEGGLLLSQAMLKHPKVFTRLYVSMVEAGEAAGILDIVLDRVAFQIEKQEAIRRRIKGAMVYPSMVLIFATLVLVGMLMFLVPVFVKIFSDLGGQLPTLTQYVVTASNLLKNQPYVLLIIPGGLWAFFRWKKTEKGRQNWDKFKLKLPMKIGDVVLKVAMARFSRTLSTLVAPASTSSRRSRSPGRRPATGWSRMRSRPSARRCTRASRSRSR
jgi:Type II secretory pathway, component PulF